MYLQNVMNRILMLLAIIVFSAILVSAQDDTGRYEVEGVHRYEVVVGDFNRLKITNDLNVEYVLNPDSAGVAVFYTTREKVNSILFSNKKSRLVIEVSTENAIKPRDLPVVRVYSSEIEELENDADSTLRVFNVVQPDKKLKLRLSDNGKIISHGIGVKEVEASILTGKGLVILSGKCDKANLRCTGTGEIQADELDAVDVDCMILGTGTIGCWPNGGKLTIKGSGTGKVYYKGMPSEIKSYQLGKIKAIPLRNVENGNQDDAGNDA